MNVAQTHVNISKRIVDSTICFCVLLLIVRVILSLRWPIAHDSPLMLYVGFLMNEHGIVPYRDLFDMNMLGTYLINCLHGRLFGYGDLGFRIGDLLYLLAISSMTYLWIKHIDKYVAAFVSLVFPIVYLKYGPIMSMQREYLALLPFVFSLVLLIPKRTTLGKSRLLAAGLLWGISALIKPHFLLGVPPILLYLAISSHDDVKSDKGSTIRHIARLTAWCVLGGLIPILLAAVYLLVTGSFGAFIDIAFNYWPLYTRMTMDHGILEGLPRLIYLLHMIQEGMKQFWLPTAVCGLIIAAHQLRENRFVLLVFGMLASFMVYAVLGGQFWFYHWFPFEYWLVVGTGLCLLPLRKKKLALPGHFSLVLVVFFVLIYIGNVLPSAISEINNWDKPMMAKNGVPNRISHYLGANLRQGDTVQPLDWTGGAVQGMLQAKAVLATSFLYDFHFYHHISSPYIHKLRSRFIRELRANHPRFIIQVIRDKPWPHGPNTTREFPELSGLLNRDYRVAKEDDFFVIYERIARETASINYLRQLQ